MAKNIIGNNGLTGILWATVASNSKRNLKKLYCVFVAQSAFVVLTLLLILVF